MTHRFTILTFLASALSTACGGDVQVVEITTPPTAEIQSPGQNSQVFEAGGLVTFDGVVQDQQDSPDRLAASWSSDRDGLLEEATPDSTGRVTFATVDLSPGTHVVTLQVIDSDAEVGEANVSLIVERLNTEPSVEIDYPGNGDEFVEGLAATFTAMASDPDAEDPPTSLQVEWSSDADGFLGNDGPDATGGLSLSTTSLSLGDHLVSVKVTDSAGEIATDQVFVRVIEANEPPEVMISSPLTGDSILRTAASFAGQVADDADRADYLAISWESDIDGVINWDSASSAGLLAFTTSALSVGAHTITLSAQDTGDLVATDSVSISVVAPADWDADGDGWTPNEGDCDDAEPATSPSATETCDDIDNDCDGDINEGLGDGYEPNDVTPTDLGQMEGDGYCVYYLGYVSGSADTQTVSGTIHTPDDVDSFTFSTNDDWYDCLDQSGYGIQVALTNVPPGHDYALDLYWVSGGDALVASSDTAYNANEYVTYEGSYGMTSDTDDGGTFEVVVSPSSGSGYGCSSSYSLAVTVW